jgi:aspartyl-tRNA(Asn)/glutamyl-tRNA(Gln) amidotransferase subunit A
VKRRILTGTYVLSSGYYDAYYNRALKVKKVVTREFDRAFEDVDMLLMPASPTLPFKKGENVDDPIKMYMVDVFTLPMNLAGLPGLSVNTGYTDEGLPLGVQLIGPRWGEETLLGAAHVLEKVFGVPRIAGGDC